MPAVSCYVCAAVNARSLPGNDGLDGGGGSFGECCAFSPHIPQGVRKTERFWSFMLSTSLA